MFGTKTIHAGFLTPWDVAYKTGVIRSKLAVGGTTINGQTKSMNCIITGPATHVEGFGAQIYRWWKIEPTMIWSCPYMIHQIDYSVWSKTPANSSLLKWHEARRGVMAGSLTNKLQASLVKGPYPSKYCSVGSGIPIQNLVWSYCLFKGCYSMMTIMMVMVITLLLRNYDIDDNNDVMKHHTAWPHDDTTWPHHLSRTHPKNWPAERHANEHRAKPVQESPLWGECSVKKGWDVWQLTDFLDVDKLSLVTHQGICAIEMVGVTTATLHLGLHQRQTGKPIKWSTTGSSQRISMNAFSAIANLWPFGTVNHLFSINIKQLWTQVVQNATGTTNRNHCVCPETHVWTVKSLGCGVFGFFGVLIWG